jgi:predicted alpha-1,2-mannosidase
MKRKLSLLFYSFLSISLAFAQKPAKPTLVKEASSVPLPNKYINTYIGFQSSNTQITAQMPWGMVSMGPNFVPRYKNYDKMQIHGFGSLHLSGVGCNQFQTGVTFIPTQGELLYSKKNNSSTFSNEETIPGYYKNTIDKFNIQSEMTATERSGIMRFVYPEGKSNLIVDLGQKLSKSHIHWSSIEKVSDSEFQGNMEENAFCSGESGHEVYYFIRLSKPAENFKFFHRGKIVEEKADEFWQDTIALGLTFNMKRGDTLEVSIGISYTSAENAKLNLDTEQKGKNFAKIRSEAESKWNEELSKIKVEGSDDTDKTIFYTALYHMLFHPHIVSDVNGSYAAMNSRNILKSDFPRYSTYSLWDTYRNLHPFLALVYPERQLDMVRSMVGMYKEGGWLPKWEHASRETYNMNGDPAVPVIVDTYMKGISDFDVNTAYEAIKKQATNTEAGNKLRPGLYQYLKYGYIPIDDMGVYYVPGPVSTTLEYTFADWTIAKMAEAMGKDADAKEFYRRSDFYKNVFDKGTNFMRGRLKDGSFVTPFDSTSWIQEIYEEGNAWQYTFMVPQDQPGLIKLMGGEKTYINKLQKLFNDDQFMMGNEPDIVYPYLFNYVKGEAWRTQKTVRENLRIYYKNTPTGISGDDDCGTMSAWAVCAMIGVYPVCPGSNQYALTSPVFNKVTIKLNQKFYPGKEFTIDAANNSAKNIFIKSMTLNGANSVNYFIDHKDIVNGGKLTMKLSAEK